MYESAGGGALLLVSVRLGCFVLNRSAVEHPAANWSAAVRVLANRAQMRVLGAGGCPCAQCDSGDLICAAGCSLGLLPRENGGF